MTPNQLPNFDDHINIFTYYHIKNCMISAVNLWYNGYRLFETAKVIKDFEIFKNLNYTETTPPDLNIIQPFILEGLMDDIRIITCMENYMKGELLLEGCVIHIINKNAKLKKEQYKRPIKISEVFTKKSYERGNFDNKENSETKNKTLGFSTLLLPEYQEIIKLPKNILQIIVKMNEQRNKLHFIHKTQFTYSKSLVAELEELRKFVNGNMLGKILELQKKL